MTYVEPLEGFDPNTEDDPSVPFDSLETLESSGARDVFDEQTRVVAALRIDAMCEAVGLIEEEQHATEAMQRLAKMVARQCLDVIAQPASEKFDHTTVIEQMFAVQATVYEAGVGMAFRATLCNARHLIAARTHELEAVFSGSLMDTLGDGAAVFRAYDAWIEVEGDGAEWLAAQSVAHQAVLSRLSSTEAAKLALGRELGAHFEVEFIRDV